MKGVRQTTSELQLCYATRKPTLLHAIMTSQLPPPRASEVPQNTSHVYRGTSASTSLCLDPPTPVDTACLGSHSTDIWRGAVECAGNTQKNTPRIVELFRTPAIVFDLTIAFHCFAGGQLRTVACPTAHIPTLSLTLRSRQSTVLYEVHRGALTCLVLACVLFVRTARRAVRASL